MLDKTPKALQPTLKEDLRQLYEAIDMESARKMRDQILVKYETKASKAAALLDEASAIRLLGALLMEQSEKWQTGRKYFEMDQYHQMIKEQTAVETKVA
ncbi:Transposase, Mutator family [Tindallia magadiensis]|uniref:Transposase, Mutator family n=1 Tax=Tindallia magadiensis TaxID=69895 RepID=A0A1I3G9X5_9FIRM|nr:Transposase, Mutator family [Tindallia magadiensis]